mmetsp:Transcript_87354/g.189201  ORF Transcript_87354/g.189201 Transcript_87354/m.189201 type:complete len:247 (-) Transcript_87354:3-743(-)
MSRWAHRVGRDLLGPRAPLQRSAPAAVAGLAALAVDALVLHEGALDRGVGGGLGAAVELRRALAVLRADLVGEVLGLVREVAGVGGALRDLAELLLVGLAGVHGVAPRRVHALVRVAAVVVVAEAVAVGGDLAGRGVLLVDHLLRVGGRRDLGRVLPRVDLAPLLAGAAADGARDEAAVALALGAALLQGAVGHHVAGRVERGELRSVRADGRHLGEGEREDDSLHASAGHGSCWCDCFNETGNVY